MYVTIMCMLVMNRCSFHGVGIFHALLVLIREGGEISFVVIGL